MLVGMGTADSQIEVKIVDGRVLFNGIEVDDVIDEEASEYRQRRMSDQLTSARLAFRAGFAVAAATGAHGRTPGTRQHRIASR